MVVPTPILSNEMCKKRITSFKMEHHYVSVFTDERIELVIAFPEVNQTFFIYIISDSGVVCIFSHSLIDV